MKNAYSIFLHEFNTCYKKKQFLTRKRYNSLLKVKLKCETESFTWHFIGFDECFFSFNRPPFILPRIQVSSTSLVLVRIQNRQLHCDKFFDKGGEIKKKIEHIGSCFH